MSVHKIICGKSEIELKRFDDNTFDSCVTDPPYGLEFMGKDWDKFKNGENIAGGTISTEEGSYWKKRPNIPSFYQLNNTDLLAFQQFTYEWATELYRVMKSGAHILVFGGTRTYHRMACAIEDAGFEIRDMVEWFYGSGFPKSLDISKSIDKMKGKEREVVGQNLHGVGSWMLPHKQNHRADGGTGIGYADGSGKEFDITVPSSEEAIQWDGWGTGLKPAHEPILLARKPISEKNIASNVLKYGTGGLNIDECRIEHNEPIKETNRDSRGASWNNDNCGFRNEQNKLASASPQGRFPANVILDDDAGEMLDEQSGELTTGEMNSTAKGGQYATYGYQYPRKTISHKSKGGASHFFYQAKASQNERWFYCMICKQTYPMKEKDNHIHNAPEKTKYQYLVFHPTQKPEALISYLARLITPPNGKMLDPFLGSGTGLIVADREGFNCTGIDSKREYCLMSHQRLKNEIEQGQTKLFSERSTIERINF